MGRLELAWLGTPEVRHAGAAVTFPTRKALALLAYLAVEGGMHSREKLSALFWPESDAEHGRTALRKTLAFLRSALRDTSDPQPSPAAPHLIVAREALGLNTASDLDLDLQTLQTAWTLAHTPAVRLEDEARGRLLDRLQAAVERYRGDFLEGFALSDAPAFDEWAGVQREVWRHRAQAVCERLVQLHSEAGEVQRAIDTVLRWLALDPLDEEAHRYLMQLHLRAGDRPAALRAYQACQAVLAAELGVEPAPETIALAERIRRGDPAGLEELYEVFRQGIRFQLYRQLGPDDLDDRVHDVFLIVVQAIQRGEIREPERLMGFVRTVVRRQVAGYIEEMVHARRDFQNLEGLPPVADDSQTPEELAMARQRTEIMEVVLRSVSRRDREILTRFYLLGQSQEQICREMKLTETQFRLLKSRAKARFGELGKKKLARRPVQAVTGLAGITGTRAAGGPARP